jgi:ATP-dependent exoDNAse (exonuclease V) beta subunit
MSAAQALFNLSPAQQQVVDHRGADLQVIACAGSGKTESVSRRVTALIAEGAEPSSIVAFTFTERAATELKERITHRVAKMLMDAVYHPVHFRNEIIWQRTLAKALMTRRLPTNHDVLLVYQAGSGTGIALTRGLIRLIVARKKPTIIPTSKSTTSACS